MGDDPGVATRNNEPAISEDGAGKSWHRIVVASARPASTYPEGGAYPTIFEAEPDVIFYQADAECWRIALKPRGVDTCE